MKIPVKLSKRCFIAAMVVCVGGLNLGESRVNFSAWAQTPSSEQTCGEISSVRLDKRGKRKFIVGTTVIDAKPEKVWDVLVDYENAPAIFKNMASCKIVGQRGQSKLVRQVLRTGFPFTFDYVVALKEKKPDSIEWVRDSGCFKEYIGSWHLTPVAQGTRTMAEYSVFVDGGLLLPSWFLEPRLQKHMPIVLKALKDKVESGRPTS